MDFWISYVGEDRRWADWLAWQLTQAGYTVEHGLLDLTPGENFVSHVEGALDTAQTLLVVHSHAYGRMARSATELETALQRWQARIAVAIVESLEDPGPFRTTRHFDFQELEVEPARQLLMRIAAQTAERPRVAPAFPGTHETEPALPVSAAKPGVPKVQVLAICAPEDEQLALAIRADVDSAKVPAEFGVVVVRDNDFVSTADIVTGALEADLILLVVSRDFIATGYGDSLEMHELIDQHRQRHAVIIPIIARECAWQRQPYGRLSTLPRGGVPISMYDSRDSALRFISDGIRVTIRELVEPPAPDTHLGRWTGEVVALRDVFIPTGVPTHTFVEPEYFPEFCLALQQPGLGVVLEGPSGVGKTTMLRWAVERERDEIGEVRILSARDPKDLSLIERLPDGHTGIVAVDDFHRLSPGAQESLSNYAKLLADRAAEEKVVLVGIPGTAGHLVDLAPDLAARIRVFQPVLAPESLVVQMIEKGESALNIYFPAKAEIAREAAGSLLTAQTLCWQLAGLAGVKRTTRQRLRVDSDLGYALAGAARALDLRYLKAVRKFAELDGETETICIDLLMSLAATPDGVFDLSAAEASRDLSSAVRLMLENETLRRSLEDPLIRAHVFLDPRGTQIVADDPQFLFYLRQRGRDWLMRLAGKRVPVQRTHAFVCYSHRDHYWHTRLLVHLDPLQRSGRVDIWSDTRIHSGDLWRHEISAALDQAVVAILLVSADMLASDFIRDEELPRLLIKAGSEGCRIIPLLVGPSSFLKMQSLSRYQTPNPGGKSLSEMSKASAEVVLRDLGIELARLLKIDEL